MGNLYSFGGSKMTLDFDKTSDTRSQKSINYSSSSDIPALINEKKPKIEIKIGVNKATTNAFKVIESPSKKPGVLKFM
jgi:hypothetical protein